MSKPLKPYEVIDMLGTLVRGKYPCVSGVLGQLIIEVGFGLKTPRDMVTGKESYNLGNIKGTGPAGSVTIVTREHYTAAQVVAAERSGVLIKVIGKDPADPRLTIVLVKDQFRAYRNYAEAIEDHFKLLQKPRYVRAGLWDARTPESFATALKVAGYATDSRYVDKIMSIVNKYQLRRFDAPSVERKRIVIPGKPMIYGILQDATTWVAAREFGYAVGAVIGYDGKSVFVNGKALPTRLIDGRGHVPIRPLAAACGFKLELKDKTITLRRG